MQQHTRYLSYDTTQKTVLFEGEWTVTHLKDIANQANQLTFANAATISFDGEHITALDSAGAFELLQLKETLEAKGFAIDWANFKKDQQHLLKIVEDKKTPVPNAQQPSFFARTGQFTFEQIEEMFAYFSFIGVLSLEALRIYAQPKRYRPSAIAATIYRTGVTALPIVALLSFMVGVVITYQMGLQLKSYGANIFIVDLLGLAILREFGPLLTAIMVAGRSGSAFTAQLGMMKINQEVDALNTMGITPAEVLLLPRIVGLLISLPLLTIWADFFGIFGGMVMSNSMLDITFYDFINRFPQVIKLRNLLIGLGKAPVFALIIASIGCYEGMRVKNDADSVGKNTTRSVVLAIFFIIVADAIFSIIFSKLKL